MRRSASGERTTTVVRASAGPNRLPSYAVNATGTSGPGTRSRRPATVTADSVRGPRRYDHRRMELGRKHVIVTGAASGIGRALSQRFAAEGASVVAADRNGAGARATAGEITAA